MWLVPAQLTVRYNTKQGIAVRACCSTYSRAEHPGVMILCILLPELETLLHTIHTHTHTNASLSLSRDAKYGTLLNSRLTFAT